MFRHNIVLIAVIFIALNVLLIFLAVPDGHFQADSAEYIQPARQLVDALRTADLSAANAIQIPRRQPGYVLLVAGAYAITTNHFDLVVVLFQISALFLTGLIAFNIVEARQPGWGWLVLLLVIFNPNAIGIAHLIMPMTIFALFLSGSIWIALEYAKKPILKHACLSGLCLGLAYLFRSEAKYLGYLLPIGLPLLAALSANWGTWHRHLIAGGTALLFVLAPDLAWKAVSPTFTTHTQAADGSAAANFVIGNLGFLELRIDPTLSFLERRARVLDRAREVIAQQHDIPISEVSYAEAHRQDVWFYFRLFPQYPYSVLIAAFAESPVKLFVSGGAQNLHELIGSGIKSSHQIFVEGIHSSRFSAWIESLRTASPAALLLTFAAVGYAVVARILGLVGIATMIAQRHWPLLILIGSILLYWTAILLTNGMSRYRVPLEPWLMILATYGIASLWERWKARRIFLRQTAA